MLLLKLNGIYLIKNLTLTLPQRNKIFRIGQNKKNNSEIMTKICKNYYPRTVKNCTEKETRKTWVQHYSIASKIEVGNTH